MTPKEEPLTEDEHFKRIQQSGEAYLHISLAPHVSGEERGRIICIALKFLNAKTRKTLTETSASQSTTFSQAAPQQTRTSSFLSTLAASLDFDIPLPILISVAVEAANLKLLPVLSKCLSILAKKRSVTESNCDEIGITSPPRKRRAPNTDAKMKRKSKKSKSEGLYDDVSLHEGVKSDDGEAEANIENDDIEKDLNHFQGRTGQAFVDDFVLKLVQLDHAATASKERVDDVFLASIAREAPLTASATKNVLISLLDRMRSVKLDELPAFVYQTLLFASAKGGQTLKKLLLISLTQQFKKVEETAKQTDQATQSLVLEDEDAITSNMPTAKEIRQVQGTTLFHLDYALKQDPGLAAELVKLGKSKTDAQAQFMTPFGIAILMSIARSPSAQTEVLSHIRDTVARFEKEQSVRMKNLFAARVTLNDEELVQPSESLIEAAKRAGGEGWEFISEPFFSFANTLLDQPVSGQKTLGIDLLRVLFCAQPSMRKPIMEQVVSRIALREKSAADAISVIGILSRRVPLDVLELNFFIRQSIEDCVRLPPATAAALIGALKPLLRSRRDLLDYFFLVMRKALFHRESSNRAVAAYGFLNILAFHTDISDTAQENGGSREKPPRRRSNQARSSRVKSGITDADITRIKAASQPLRRAMTHPPALKALLYKEIGSFLSCLNDNAEREAVCISIKGLLRPHFLKFIDATNPPYILIDFCVDESAGGVLLEPLGDFIQCLATLESLVIADTSQESYIVELARKLASVSITDFSISKDTVCGGGAGDTQEPDAQQLAEQAAAKANRNRARVLGNVAEALISATIAASKTSDDPKLFVDVIFPLLTLREKVLDVLKHLGCASLTDAIRDLGGDASIESSYSFPMGLKRPGRPSTSLKKPGKSSKGPVKGAGKLATDGSSNTSSSAADYRFGAFNVLYSAAHAPTMPLLTAIQCLEKIAYCTNDSEGVSKFFAERQDDQNVDALHSYVLVIAMKHVQNINLQCSKSPWIASQKSKVSSAICSVSRIAMQDFKRMRARTGSQAVSDQLCALHIVEACSKSLAIVFDNDYTFCTHLAASLIPDVDGDSDDESSIESVMLGFIEELVEDLLGDESFKECASLLGTYTNFTNCIDQSSKTIETKSSIRERQAKWARNALVKYDSADTSTVRIMTAMAMLYSANNDDLRVSEEIIDRIHVVVGDCDATADAPQPTLAEGDKSLAFAESIRRATSLGAVDSVLDTLDNALTDVEWCLARMLSLELTAAAASENADHDSRSTPLPFLYAERNREKKAAQQTNRAEDAAQTRLEGVIRNLQALTCCAVAKWALQERILRIVTRTYKQLSIATQAQIKRKADPRTSFVSMIEACKALGPCLWMYLAFLGTDAGQDVSRKGGKASKEARIMPQLVFEVERFENLLISAQKHTRINLLKGMRRNTARDFRIQEDLLKTSEGPSNGE